MTRFEEDFYISMTALARELKKQLKIMNKLKALELKGRVDLKISPEMVDDVMEDD